MDDHSEKSLSALAEEVNVFFKKGAHDIRNLLQMVHLWVNTNRASDREQAVGLLEELEAYYTHRIDQLRHSFEEFRSIQSGFAPITSLSVSTLITTVLDEMEGRLGKDPSVKTLLDPEAVLLYSEVHLKNAIRALLDNAVRYRKADQALRISIEVQREEKGVLLSIQDNGIGIDKSRYGEQIFQPFVRCTQQSDGQGISLHLIKTLVEKNGGRIAVSSQLGKGTTITLHLVNQREAHGGGA